MRTHHRAWPDALFALAHYALAAAVVFLGALWGVGSYREAAPRQAAEAYDPTSLVDRLTRWSGDGYRQIAERGYRYHPDRASLVALFPAYPLAARGVQHLFAVRTDAALLVVSHVCLAAAFIVLGYYVNRRFPHERELLGCTLLALALYPPAFYTRLPYSEAMFLLLTTLVLVGVECRWPLAIQAALVGLATATRPVGVVLLLPWGIDLLRRSGTMKVFAVRVLVFGPLAVWGLLAYMAFLHIRFDNALAFAQTQSHYRVREAVPLAQQAWDLATLLPLRETLDETAAGFWGRQPPRTVPIFNLPLANPAYFLAALALLAIGWRKGWLHSVEISLTAGLILMPYVLRGHEMSMAAMGRFTCVAVPLYLVMGQILLRLGPGLRAALLAVAALVSAVYAATFAAGYMLL